jgi:hypothetical protein
MPVSARLPEGGLRRLTSEVDLARIVVSWLAEAGWDVYQEVEVGGCIADIVAVDGPRLWVVETKTSLGLRVIGQADRWRIWANMVSVAVPPSCSMEIASRVLGLLGIGHIVVGCHAYENLRPELRRRVGSRLRDSLRPEQRKWAEAGNAAGKRFTPFQATSKNLKELVERMPGRSIGELLPHLKTHYGSAPTARNCLVKWAEKGVIPGVKIRREGRRVLFYPDDNFETEETG